MYFRFANSAKSVAVYEYFAVPLMVGVYAEYFKVIDNGLYAEIGSTRR